MTAAAESMTGGVLVDMATPMAPDGELDLGGAVRLSRRLAAAGVDGLVLAGEAGEGEALEADERLTLWETVAAAVGGRVSLWAGVWGANERTAVRLVREAGRLGLTGVAVPLGGDGPARRSLARGVADAVAPPLMVLAATRPDGAGTDLGALYAALGDRLWAVPDAAALVPALCETGGRLRLIAPEATNAVGCAALGGAGVLSAAANVAPAAVVRLWRAAASGERAKAWAELYHLWPVLNALRRWPAACVVKRPGLAASVPGPALRPPLQALDAAQAVALDQALDLLGAGPGPAAALAG